MSPIKEFENRKIRTIWDNEKEEWFFSVVDVVGALTESVNPTDYLKKMRKRDELLSNYMGTNCPHVEMKDSNGKKRKVLAANTEQLLRIIQSIPSPKAEPFKLWLAQVGSERIEEMIDPEQAIDRALDYYRKKGYSEEWIHQRLMSIRVRRDLTDEWKHRGVEKSIEFAILTDELTKAWTGGMSTRQYKDLKDLKKENLRDNMTDTELVFNMLAEVSTANISKVEKPNTFEKNKSVAKRGGEIAGNARKELEAITGTPVITSGNPIQQSLLTDAILELTEPSLSDAEEIK